MLQTFKPERLTKFYADWYRPDLMAVVAVGDFDSQEVQRLIHAHFDVAAEAGGAEAAPGLRRARSSGHGLRDRDGQGADRRRASRSTTSCRRGPTARSASTASGSWTASSDRCCRRGSRRSRRSRTRRFSAPLPGAGRFVGRSKDTASLGALVKDGGVERGLQAVLAEAERVSRFGFTATELDRRKQTMLRARERRSRSERTCSPAPRPPSNIRNFLVGETLPSLEDEYALVARFVPEITLDEINRMAKEWCPDTNRIVIVSAPDKAGVAVPDERRWPCPECAGALKAAPRQELTAYVDTVASTVLLDTLPEPSPVARTTTKEALGITEWELSNGVKVVLKPTTFRQDEILFRAVSPGGTSLASDAGLRAGEHRDAGGRCRAASAKLSAIDLTQGPDREDRVRRRRSSASWRKGCRAAPRRRTSRRCSS